MLTIDQARQLDAALADIGYRRRRNREAVRALVDQTGKTPLELHQEQHAGYMRLRQVDIELAAEEEHVLRIDDKGEGEG